MAGPARRMIGLTLRVWDQYEDGDARTYTPAFDAGSNQWTLGEMAAYPRDLRLMQRIVDAAYEYKHASGGRGAREEYAHGQAPAGGMIDTAKEGL